MERRTVVFGGLATLLSSCFKQRTSRTHATIPKPSDPFHFPNLDVWTLEGRAQKLRSFYHGEPLLLHTVQQGCYPCKESFPVLNELTQKIDVLGLYSGWGENFANDRQEWIDETAELRMDFPSVLIANRGDMLLERYCKERFQGFNGLTFPSYFIIDSSGNCTHYQSGGLYFSDHEPKLREAVRITS